MSSRPANRFWGLLLCGAGVLACASIPPVGQPITARTVLTRLAARLPVRVENVTFSDELDFTTLTASPETPTVARVWVNAPVYFRNCTFNGKVLAFRQHGDTTVLCSFGRNLTFVGCQFNGETSFRSVSVVGIGAFSHTQFNKPVSFAGARFGAEAYFDQALFAVEARFQQARFAGMANFWQSIWAGTTYFQGATFDADAQFSLADFRANLDFSLCTTHGLLNFNYAQLPGRSSFANCRFHNAVDFNNARLHDASFSEAIFDTKASFADVDSPRISFERAFFLTRPPLLNLIKPQPNAIDMTGAQVATGHLITLP